MNDTHSSPCTQAGGQETLTNTYVYTDAGGTDFYRVQRYETPGGGKRFVQQHWTGSEWKNGLNGAEPLLYNLPAINDAFTVYLTEGEKCADALNAIDLVATTLSGGSGSKWCDSFTEALSGKQVVILPDNDLPGAKYARRAAVALLGHCQVHILQLPDLPPAGDVDDWLNLQSWPGNDELEALVENCPAVTSQADIDRLLPPEQPKQDQEQPKPQQEQHTNGKSHDDLPLTAEDIDACLSVISAVTHTDAVPVLLAVKAAGGKFEQFRRWRLQHISIKQGEPDKSEAKIKAAWKGAKPTKIGTGTLIYMARQADPDFVTPSLKARQRDGDHLGGDFGPEDGQQEGAGDAGADNSRKDDGTAKPVSPFLSLREAMQLKAASFRIDRLLFERGTGFMAGESQVGKSFVQVHLGMCAALGLPMYSREVSEPCGVLFALYEGGSGFPDRILGWLKHYQATPEDIKAVEERVRILPVDAAPDLMDDKSVDLFIRQVKQFFPDVRLVFVDTFSKASIGADENSAVDMKKAHHNAERIARGIDGFVMLIHHFGKDAKRGMRGSSSLRQSADSVFEITRRGNDAIQLFVRKLKDGEDGFYLMFDKLKVDAVDPDTGKVRQQTLVVTESLVPPSHPDILMTIVQGWPEGIHNDDLAEEFASQTGKDSNTFRSIKSRLIKAKRIKENDHIITINEG